MENWEENVYIVCFNIQIETPCSSKVKCTTSMEIPSLFFKHKVINSRQFDGGKQEMGQQSKSAQYHGSATVENQDAKVYLRRNSQVRQLTFCWQFQERLDLAKFHNLEMLPSHFQVQKQHPA